MLWPSANSVTETLACSVVAVGARRACDGARHRGAAGPRLLPAPVPALEPPAPELPSVPARPPPAPFPAAPATPLAPPVPPRPPVPEPRPPVVLHPRCHSPAAPPLPAAAGPPPVPGCSNVTARSARTGTRTSAPSVPGSAASSRLFRTTARSSTRRCHPSNFRQPRWKCRSAPPLPPAPPGL